jgi:hypothetical protein
MIISRGEKPMRPEGKELYNELGPLDKNSVVNTLSSLVYGNGLPRHDVLEICRYVLGILTTLQTEVKITKPATLPPTPWSLTNSEAIKDSKDNFIMFDDETKQYIVDLVNKDGE